MDAATSLTARRLGARDVTERPQNGHWLSAARTWRLQLGHGWSEFMVRSSLSAARTAAWIFAVDALAIDDARFAFSARGAATATVFAVRTSARSRP